MLTIEIKLAFVTFTALLSSSCDTGDAWIIILFLVVLSPLVLWKSENPYFIGVLGDAQNLLEPLWQLKPTGDMVTLQEQVRLRRKKSHYGIIIFGCEIAYIDL